MDSQLNLAVRITHTQNLPRAEVLAALAAAALNEALAADPRLLVTATLQSAAIATAEKTPAVSLPERYHYLRR